MKKAAKKTSPKKRTEKTVKKTTPKVQKVQKPVSKNVNIKIDKEKLQGTLKSAAKVLVLVLILLVVDFFVQYLNNGYSVAIVDGQRIPRKEYVENLEKLYGLQIVNAMIEEELVGQLGKKEGVEVNEDQVNEKYDEFANENFGGLEGLEEALEANNMTADQLKDQLKNELLLREIIEPTLEYTDEDLAEFFEQYKSVIYENEADAVFEDKRDEIEEMYINEKTYEQREILLTEFKDEITIQINVPGGEQEEVTYGLFKATRNLISNFIDERNSN